MPQATASTANPSLKRAAALMSALGGALPPGVLEGLPPTQRVALEQAAKQMSTSPADERRALLRELATDCRKAAHEGSPAGPRPAASRVAQSRAPGEDTSPLTVPAATPLAWTTDAPVEMLLAALEHERPQVWAAVVAYAPRDVAEALVTAMEPGRAQEVALAITRTGPPAPGALQALDAALAEEVARLRDREERRREGVRSLARSLERVPRELARGTLRALEGRDAILARAVAEQLELGREASDTGAMAAAADETSAAPLRGTVGTGLALALERA